MAAKKTAAHLLAERKMSVDCDDSCVYSGSGCAAAPFIKPEFRELADSYGAWPNVKRRSSHEAEFVRQLQMAHDGAKHGEGFLHSWKLTMRGIASRNNLSTALIDEDDKREEVCCG